VKQQRVHGTIATDMEAPVDQPGGKAARRLVEASRTGELRLAPVLPEEELAAFERSHGISLPDDYRWFVTRLGNGGEGPPYYGMEPLSDRLIEANSAIHPAQNRNRRLAEPFAAYAKDWSDLAEDRADYEWATLEPGRLLLGTDGCAILWVLAVAGVARGQVWRVGDDSARPADPPGFLDWYAAWLARRPPRRPDDPTPLALTDGTARTAGGHLRGMLSRFRLPR
jgi:hypothetical protein